MDIIRETLTEMLRHEAYESYDEDSLIYVEEAKAVFKKWLEAAGLPYGSTESARQLLITLVDEP